LHSGNRVSRILNTDYPIIQGGMAWASDPILAAAVSNAGGMGMLASGSMSAKDLSLEIEKTRTLTERVFGVNVMMLSPYLDEIVDLLVQDKVHLVTLGAGNPGKVIDKLKSAGILVAPVIASVAMARRAESVGADMVIAEGMEAGGHIGRITTMALIPQVADVIQIPVVAAGGIADARGMAAAFCLGAEGVQMGTRFVCSVECQVHNNYKERLLRASELDAIIAGVGSGHPIRCLRNSLTRKIDAMEKRGAEFEEIERIAVGGLRRAVKEGDVDNGSVMAGQICGLLREIVPVETIIRSMMEELTHIFLDHSGESIS